MKYVGLVIDENCFQIDGPVLTYALLINAESKVRLRRLESVCDEQTRDPSFSSKI